MGKKRFLIFSMFFCSLLINNRNGTLYEEKKTFESFYSHLLSLHKKKKHFVWKEKTVFLIFYDCILNSEWHITFSFEIKTGNGAWCTKNFFCFKFNLFCKFIKFKMFLNLQKKKKKMQHAWYILWHNIPFDISQICWIKM